ncbi:MAG: stage III sporulation protein AB [Clostridia bacterium]|nr:stage III sporulation protein AB [Clostridia bacterium]
MLILTINLIGIHILMQYNKRIVFWQHMKKLTEYFANEIRYTSDSPYRILLRFLRQYPYDGWCLNDGEEREFHKLFLCLIQPTLVQLAIPKEQRTLIESYALGVGRTDTEGQLCHMEHYGIRFQELFETARRDKQSKGKLYQRLCVLTSIGIGILLV